MVLLTRIVVTVLLVAAGCAAPTRYKVDDTLFTLEFDRGWEIGRDASGDTIEYVFRRARDDVEVHVVAWLVRRPLEDAATEALRRLRSSSTLELGAHRPVAGTRLSCLPEGRKVRIFEEEQPLVDLIQDGRWRSLLAAGHADGSLVAVVVRRPGASATRCESVSEMDQALEGIVRGLRPSRWPLAPSPPTSGGYTRTIPVPRFSPGPNLFFL